MTRVLAQGMFDVLHPGHIYYLEESAKLGDELVVIVGRDVHAHNRPLILGEETRLELVQALDMVDKAVLGSETDMFEKVDELRPDILTLGYDQPYDEDDLREMLHDRDLDDIQLVRLDKWDGPVASSSQIRARIAEMQHPTGEE